MSTKYFIQADPFTLTAATAKTVLELPTPANVSVCLKELWISAKEPAANNIQVEFGTYATTGTGTATTPQKMAGDRTIDSAITGAKIHDTVEPTTFTPGTAGALYWPGFYVPLPGMFMYQWVLAEEFAIAESTLFGIRMTATSTITTGVSFFISWTE